VRPQRLAAPATIYVEQHSAHPLEADAAELYGPPDGYIDADGAFRKQRASPNDKPVYEVELRPEDGLYPLPYMAVQADGQPWEEECASAGAPEAKARQGFFPDGSRSFEEIDRLSVMMNGTSNGISAKAAVDFYRVAPPAGYTKGVRRAPHRHRRRRHRGRDPRPAFLSLQACISPPPASVLCWRRSPTTCRRFLSSGKYLGAIWTQGSPQVEEAAYWFNLLIDSYLPICGNAAQRPHGQASNDGPKNILDPVDYITSRVWADEEGATAPARW
jgi:hypothetical protein